MGAALGLNDVLQHFLNHSGGIFRQHLLGVGQTVHPQQRHRHLATVVGQNRIGLRQLNGGYRQAVAIGKGRGFGRAPGAVGRQLADAFARETNTGVLTQAHRRHGVMYRFAANIQRHLAHADVTGLEQNARQIEYATRCP